MSYLYALKGVTPPKIQQRLLKLFSLARGNFELFARL